MAPELRVISSMATRRLLAALAGQFESATTQRVVVESVGGVEAARRVAAGEPFDGVVLASGPLDKLMEQGRLVPGSRVDVAASSMGVAVPAGATRPDIGSEDAVRRALLAARHVGYSTGPSGDHLQALIRRWGIDAAMHDRLVQAPPGVPVATLLARGDVDLGFQQLSELTSVAGVDVLGPLPPAIQSLTVFAGAIAAASSRPDAMRALLAFMAAPDAAGIKRDHGME